MHKNFTNRIVNDEKNINTEIFNEYFKYQNPSFLIKDIYNANQTRNEQIVNQVNDALIDLRNTVKKKENSWKWKPTWSNQNCWKNPWP